MLRLVLLEFYLAFLYNSGQAKIGGGLDPDGVTAPPPSPTVPHQIGGGLDPNGLVAKPQPGETPGGGGNLDPNG